MNIHVSNLNIRTTAGDIRQLFSHLENITVRRVRFIKDSFTQIITTFTYIYIADDALAVKAIQVLNDTTLHGSKIVARASEPNTRLI